MAKIIIDGEGAVFGRLCSFAAKKALEGNDIIVINSEKTVISGSKTGILDKYKTLRGKGGHSLKGPKISKVSYKILKRAIRGMVPDHREGIGRVAIKRVICYDGIPEEYKNVETTKIKQIKHDKYIELKELVRRM